jgi:hypothetical protein
VNASGLIAFLRRGYLGGYLGGYLAGYLGG